MDPYSILTIIFRCKSTAHSDIISCHIDGGRTVILLATAMTATDSAHLFSRDFNHILSSSAISCCLSARITVWRWT